MTIITGAPWHKASFDRFLHERLPQLLAEHVPLFSYAATVSDRYTCQIELILSSPAGNVVVVYEGLPQPDQEGIFQFKGKRLVVVPYASHDDLENAEIFCVGEQLESYLRERLGKAPDELAWDTEMARTWLPLNLWIEEFFAKPPRHAWPSPDTHWTTCVQALDDTNWLARHSHLRRLSIMNRQHLFRPGHFGRTCPFETPEGPNIGRILPIALGAEIRNGKLLIIDEQPEATLGLEAAMIPLLEHNAPERLLMGTNMLRQWIVPPSPEPALIQSGNEPDAPGFWCGRNLLTAFLSWGEDTYEDGIVLSESCARRLSYTRPAEPGDKLSNRHGVKGVISRILSDEEMPHLADGTPVELVFNFISQHARAYFGQVREAVLSRIAHAEGRPMIIPPSHAPAEQEIRLRLAQAGLAVDGMEQLIDGQNDDLALPGFLLFEVDGMEQLIDGQNGRPLAGPSTVGWVYWGKLVHQAREKLQVATESSRGQRLNEYDYYALREAGAFEVIREAFNTSAAGHAEGESLTKQIARGGIEQAGAPSPQLSTLLKRLDAVGIRGELSESGLAFHLGEPGGVAIDLATPVTHPWLRGHTLTRIGVNGGDRAAYQALAEANIRLWHMLSSGAPASLKQQAQAQLVVRVQEYCATLLPALQFATRVQFSGRAVLAPGPNLHLDQVGVAEELAWPLFGPLVTRELTVEEVEARSEQATHVLDEIMARCWVIIHRSPAFTPQTFLAFHPVRIPERVLRLHPLVCRLLQVDFDGDQAAIFLPLTEQAQQEAGDHLSVAAHLTHTPELLRDLLPNNEALWGLASLSLVEEGKQKIAACIGTNRVPAGEIVTRALLEETLQQILRRDGIPAALELLEELTQLGFAAARASGASISPFVGSRFPLPPVPTEDDGKLWNRYQQEVSEWLAAHADYTQPDLGPQLVAVKSGAWGQVEQLTGLLSTQGVVKDVLGRPVPIRHGYRDGLPLAELFALAIGARENFAQVQHEWMEISQEIRKRDRAQSFHVLARAIRAEQPALVFAHAASIRERDPLTDPDSRLFAGLSARTPLL